MSEVYMACAECGAAMRPRALGGWERRCDCKAGRYWLNLPPLASDNAVFIQLTGLEIANGLHIPAGNYGGFDKVNSKKVWRYGRKP